MFYATCSLLREENDLLIHKFLEKKEDVEIVKLNVPKNITNALFTDYGCNLLPFDKISDGFFCSLIAKKTI